MRSNREGDFEASIRQLIQLLRKLMKEYPGEIKKSKYKPLFQEQGINFNVFFLNILPLLDEDWEELEQFYGSEAGPEAGKTDFDDELNAEDLDFLKKNGIRF